MNDSAAAESSQGGGRRRSGWSTFPDAPGGATRQSGARRGASADVVGIGALCERRPSPHGHADAHSFSVSEFLELADGERVVLHQERGFTTSVVGGVGAGSITRDDLEQDVLNAVLPDDAGETGEDHPWEWLATLARSHGIDVTPEALRQLDYRVVLSPDVLGWVGP